MESVLLQILKWAAGAPEYLTPIQDLVQDVDEDALLQLIAAHGLYNRLSRRIQAEHPRWASRNFSIRLFGLSRHARQVVHQQAEALREIVLALPAGTPAVIPVKGFSLYALTGESDNLRASGDIDVFADDLEGLRAVMTGLGYSTEESHGGGSHFAVMYRNGVQIEVHRSFPVWAYPPGLVMADMRFQSHPRVWAQPFSDLRETAIGYWDIAEGAGPGAAPEMQDLTLPNLTMMALLLCVHVFRHYVEGQALDSPIVRLGELADIHDLMRHPRFNGKRFWALVALLSAHDAVSFVRHLLHLFLGADPIGALDQAGAPDQGRNQGQTPDGAGLSGMASFPMLLSSWSGWAAPHAPDELLQRLNPQDVFDRLGPNRVTAGCGWYDAFPLAHGGAAGAGILSRIIVQSVAQQQLPVRLSVHWGGDALRFDIEILWPLPRGYRYQVLLYYPYKFQGTRPAGFETLYSNVRWAEIGHQDHERPVGSGVPAQNAPDQNGVDCGPMRLTECGCEAHLSFEWSGLPPAFSREGLVPMMALVMKIREGRSDSVCFREDTLVMLPLYVVPG